MKEIWCKEKWYFRRMENIAYTERHPLYPFNDFISLSNYGGPDTMTRMGKNRGVYGNLIGGIEKKRPIRGPRRR